MALVLKLYLLSVTLVALSANAEDLSFKDEIVRDENWLDPSNMFISKAGHSLKVYGDEHGSRGDGSDDDAVVVRPLSTRERNECREQRKELITCQKKLKDLQLLRQLINTSYDEPCTDREFIYLRRLALTLVNKAKIPKHAPRSNVKLELYLSAKDVNRIKELVTDADCEGSAEIERTLSKTLANGKATPVDKIPTSWY
ncbi:uncharacterized protein LOC111271588 isoform X2 [Varroa jacobsoni]|uniref:Chloride channel CLIC-like protein 1 n=1 Tax=Varroa destructor TaxID=109461 RepID=A0A7M7KN17_VARDE|nr:uncharacterized protein LOC111252465 isoform X2 [Varroa destructor]XP_022708231.1 uncharacterized protein LOC111271588 isoform X2 [Varroa jacobsoni]